MGSEKTLNEASLLLAWDGKAQYGMAWYDCTRQSLKVK